MKISFLILYFFTFFNLNSQNKIDESKNFIIDDNKKVIYTNKIELKVKGFKMSLNTDSSNFDLKEIKFFKYKADLFAKLPPLQGEGKYAYAKRIKKGKINLYGFVPLIKDEGGFSGGHGNPSATINSGGMGYINSSSNGKSTPSTEKLYYNKGYGELIPAKYHNLKIDLADNEKSMGFLKQYRKYKITKSIFYNSGTLIALTSAIIYINKLNSDPKYESDFHIYSTLTATLSCYIVGTIFDYKKDRQLNGAIDAYNEW